MCSIENYNETQDYYTNKFISNIYNTLFTS